MKIHPDIMFRKSCKINLEHRSTAPNVENFHVQMTFIQGFAILCIKSKPVLMKIYLHKENYSQPITLQANLKQRDHLFQTPFVTAL